MLTAKCRYGLDGGIGGHLGAQKRRCGVRVGTKKDVACGAGRKYGRNAELVEAQGLDAGEVRSPLGDRAHEPRVHVVDFAHTATN